MKLRTSAKPRASSHLSAHEPGLPHESQHRVKGAHVRLGSSLHGRLREISKSCPRYTRTKSKRHSTIMPDASASMAVVKRLKRGPKNKCNTGGCAGLMMVAANCKGFSRIVESGRNGEGVRCPAAVEFH